MIAAASFDLLRPLPAGFFLLFYESIDRDEENGSKRHKSEERDYYGGSIFAHGSTQDSRMDRYGPNYVMVRIVYLSSPILPIILLDG